MKKFLSTLAIFLMLSGVASAENKPLDDANEIQFEYLSGEPSHWRNVNNYNIHYFEKVTDNGVMSYWRGLTFTRAVGYIKSKKYDDIRHDSNGVGLGAAFMVRWNKRLSGKLHGSLDLTGSLMLYNRAHPYDGRAYGFLWRLGPRLTWQFCDTDSVSLGYSFSHFSNGLRRHNPGYNTMGLSIGYAHKF